MNNPINPVVPEGLLREAAPPLEASSRGNILLGDEIASVKIYQERRERVKTVLGIGLSISGGPGDRLRQGGKGGLYRPELFTDKL